ncbi:hypothetical protein MKK75_00985 [Methylobacterium sp. J-030]|uniref:hypothetical protein n=1 Tax=Methylobacterium sp. J-030 TaxID=2836627 RepID=UPI001FBB1AA3|nr:hypothetical protein [Methylobacterium sp. J-030]MCJ2067390.1 hypothetical protein [Methylobacterium sp. J-030]
MAFGSFIPTGEFNIEDEIACHSRMSMSLPDRATADRDFGNNLLDLETGEQEAKANGDHLSEKDYSLRQDYAKNMREAAASQDNYNRFSGNTRHPEAIESLNMLKLHKIRLEEIRVDHSNLCSQASDRNTDRQFNSIDEAPGEDRAKKAVWDQKKLRAEGEAAEARGDDATKRDCAFRWHYANAQAFGDMGKLAKIRTQHEAFRENLEKEGRKFNDLDHPRGEDPAGKAAWEQRQLWKQKEEFGRAAESARQNGDRFDLMDCQIRASHADAKLRQDAVKVRQIESTHKAFQTQTESATGRKFNDLSQPRGEDAARKTAWEQGQGQQPRAAQPRAEPMRDAARGAPQRLGMEVPGSQRRKELGQAARMQDAARALAQPAQPKPIKSEAEVYDDLSKTIKEANMNGDHAKYRDCDIRMSHIEAKKNGETSRQDMIAGQHKVFREEVQRATGREFNSLSAPQGENAEKKAEWDKRESNREHYTESHLSTREKANASKAHDESQNRLLSESKAAQEKGDTSTELDLTMRHNHAAATRQAGLANDKAMDAERAGQPDKAQGYRADRNVKSSMADTIASDHQRFREQTEQSSGRQFNDLSQPPGESKYAAMQARTKARAQQQEATGQVQPYPVKTGYMTRRREAANREANQPEQAESAMKEGATSPSGRARYLKRHGATAPEFIKLAKQDRNFAHAKQFYDERSKGFKSDLARSRELAAQQPNQPQEERPRPLVRR